MKTCTCSACQNEFAAELLTEFDHQQLCSDCLAHDTVICSRCGERIWDDDNAGTNDTPLCQNCYDDYYESCTHCGTLLRREDCFYADGDDDTPYCRDCYEKVEKNAVIHDYGYKPTPQFCGDGNRFFGVELEIDEGGENRKNAAALLDIANSGSREHIYCKHDGSLGDGFEIVTHPMTLAYHLSEMPWEDVLHEAVRMDYTSHQAGTCGLHVHVNRTAFGDTEDEQDAVIARILYFFEKHWEELLKFSRRTQHQLDQWASRYGFKEQPQDILTHAKEGRHAGRYTAVNLTNLETVEFRMFRGTLKLNTLYATLQLLDRICDVALSLSDEQLKAMSWTTFVSGCTQSELVQYLKERRLYINEPVCTAEEV